MPFVTSEIQLSDSDFPLLTDTIISQQTIEKNGNSIPISNLVLLPQVLASLDMPPNPTTLKVIDTIALSSTTSATTNTINHTSMIIDDSANTGPTNTITQGDMTIHDFVGSNLVQMTADYLQLNQPSYQTQLEATQLSISDVANGYSSTISSAIGLFNDTNGGTPLQVEIVADHTQDADPYIRLQNFNGFQNRVKFSGIYADGHNCFNLNNDNKFMKQQNPLSMQQYELLDGEFIEKYMPLVFVQNVSGLKLRDVTEYLDDNGLAGWSCIISNYNGGDITIDTSGYDWFAHSNGLSGNPIIFKKWATCRLTLVYSSIDNQYLWALSQF